MSIKKSIDIFCDFCGWWKHCGVDITAVEARKKAVAAGWSKVWHKGKYKDICPDCLSV
jgi:hypothetical protein